MDRVEPRHEQNLQDLTFRRAPRWAEPAPDHRFALGVTIFLLVALAYPWYSYWVQTRLFVRDIEQGVEEFTGAMDAVGTEVAVQAAQGAQRRREIAADAEQRRVAAVRVTGISDGNPPLAMVAIGDSNVAEASATICRQTGVWLHRSVSGTPIRVQRVRSTGVPASIQELYCP